MRRPQSSMSTFLPLVSRRWTPTSPSCNGQPTESIHSKSDGWTDGLTDRERETEKKRDRQTDKQTETDRQIRQHFHHLFQTRCRRKSLEHKVLINDIRNTIYPCAAFICPSRWLTSHSSRRHTSHLNRTLSYKGWRFWKTVQRLGELARRYSMGKLLHSLWETSGRDLPRFQRKSVSILEELKMLESTHRLISNNHSCCSRFVAYYTSVI
jgi:hypothetical protein